MKPSKLTTGLCLTTSLLLSGCPDTRTPSPPMVPKPKAVSFENTAAHVALASALIPYQVLPAAPRDSHSVNNRAGAD